MYLFLKFYSLIQRKLIRFGKFGAGSIIKFPYKVWGRKSIHIGINTFIAENSFLSAVESWEKRKYNPGLYIGSNVTIGSNFFVSCISSVRIEDNVLISDRVFISDHIHDYEDISKPIVKQDLKFKGNVLIKSGSFIGINSVIMPGVTIGKNSVIGASSVVTKDVEDFSVVAGSPAKLIKKYNHKKENKK